MEDIICYCPICQTEVLFEDLKVLDAAHASRPLASETLYCPHCEMLVEPVVALVDTIGHADPAYHDDVPAEPGRARSAAANAGGSQRGDASDEGASQWRTDPREAERNTWQPKP